MGIFVIVKCSFLWGNRLRVGCMVAVKLFSKVTLQFHLHQQCVSDLVPYHTHQHLVLPRLKNINRPDQVYNWLIIDFMCISLMTNDVKASCT